MITFPNCKINLGLNIIRKRSDGYHDLETIFYPNALNDIVEIIQSKENNPNFFQSTGLAIDGNTENNLCIKAYHLLKKDFSSLPPFQMHLHKNIPMGAGLGGGSADGAFTLKLLNDKFKLNLTQEQLINYALQLGSDCPFFIYNKACFATGRGEKITPINLNLSDYSFVLVNPKIHISTAWAFQNITPTIPPKSIKEIIHQPIETWKDELVNDFENPVIQSHPEIKSIKENLYNAGATYVSMSGSGSTVFAIFKKGMQPSFQFSENYFVKKVD